MKNWTDIVRNLSADFDPISKMVNGVPVISEGLDEGIDKILAEHVTGGLTSLNKRFVENLMSDCINRVANCQILREKAQEIENRAVDAAVTFRTQNALLDAASEIADEMREIRHLQGMNSIGLKSTVEGSEFIGDRAIWDRIRAQEENGRTAQRDAIESFMEKSRTPGNGSNFVERFTFLKSLFDINMTELYVRSLECAIGLKAVYNIDKPVPKMSTSGYLNYIAIWAQQASDELDRALAQRYLGSLTFTLAAPDESPKGLEILGLTAFNAAINAGAINFIIKKEHFSLFRMKDVLLRSVRLQVRSGTDETRTRVWSSSLTLPNTDLSLGGESFPAIFSTASADTGEETIFGVHNIPPFGDWSLRIPERSATGEVSKNEIANVYLQMRISYRREDY